jgi:hypothetical protein
MDLSKFFTTKDLNMCAMSLKECRLEDKCCELSKGQRKVVMVLQEVSTIRGGGGYNTYKVTSYDRMVVGFSLVNIAKEEL